MLNFRKYNIKPILSFLTILTFIFSSCSENNESEIKKNYSGKAKIEFFNTTYEFGTLTEGEIVECSFIFKNTGTAPLKIISVEADCGCTVPEFSKDEILPGEKGKIKAIFNTVGFRYNILKTIDVETNADSELIELIITAFIENNVM